MISATVASPRRCRMSITCRSRRDKAAEAGLRADRDRVMMSARVEGKTRTADKSALLIFQRRAPIVKGVYARACQRGLSAPPRGPRLSAGHASGRCGMARARRPRLAQSGAGRGAGWTQDATGAMHEPRMTWRARWREARRQRGMRRGVRPWGVVAIVVMILLAMYAIVMTAPRLRMYFRQASPGSVEPAPAQPIPAPARGAPSNPRAER